MRVPRPSLVLLCLAASSALAQDAPPDKPAAPPAEADRPVSRPGGPPKVQPDRAPQGDLRQQVFLPPTAEDWKKPCLITWQRTWEDAQAVARETGKPILVCVNMDGEIASEHYAGVRYRQPEVAKLYEPYVCVIASVYRHTPRDYDDQGRRVPCPRFGGVTCGEHVTLEPIMYERYLDGQRIAPRHILVELDGKERFDYYYANDVQSVLDEVKRAIVERKGAPPPAVVRGDRPITERVGSADVGDRTAVESAYEKGDAEQRKALLDAALAKGADAPLDLLRLAVFGLDADAAKKAREALAKTESKSATDLVAEALRVPMEDAEREALVAALERIGRSYPRAEWLAQTHRGLAAKSGTVDVSAWTKAVATDKSGPEVVEWYEVENRRRGSEEARRARPEDPAAWIDFAEASLEVGRKSTANASDDPRIAKMFARLAFEDARQAARQAQKLDAKDWRAEAVLALADYYGGDRESAYPRVEAAVKAMPEGAPGRNAVAVLTIFAESRYMAIRQAVRDKKRWPPQYVADVNAAYAVLDRHPLATDAQVLWHYDFLEWLNANERASRVLDDGLNRFPDSTTLHDRLRARAMKSKGVVGLEAAYDELLAAKDASPRLERFAAVASTTAGDFHRKAGNIEQALAAYERAVAHHRKMAQADPGYREAADLAEALAYAARARVAFECGEDERAVTELLRSFDKRPTAIATLDGLGITPAETAHALLTRLRDAKKDELAAKLSDAMAKLDPVLLAPKTE